MSPLIEVHDARRWLCDMRQNCDVQKSSTFSSAVDCGSDAAVQESLDANMLYFLCKHDLEKEANSILVAIRTKERQVVQKLQFGKLYIPGK